MCCRRSLYAIIPEWGHCILSINLKKLEIMNYKSKANKIGIESLALLGLRIIETVDKSGIGEAKESKQYIELESVNARYQKSIDKDNEKEASSAIKSLFKLRSELFDDMYNYLHGLMKSPDSETKDAANLLFQHVSKYGKNFDKLKIADQSFRFIRIIEAMKKPECEAAVVKTMLTEKLSTLDQIQRSYEDLYMQRGNESKKKVAPSSLRNQMAAAIKLYMEELKWMANSKGTQPWITLCNNIEKRFDEVNVSKTRKLSEATTAENSTSTK